MGWWRGENRCWHCRLRARQGTQRWILAAGLENSFPLPLELLGHPRGTQRWAQPMRADTESAASRLARWACRPRVLHAPPSAGPHGGGKPGIRKSLSWNGLVTFKKRVCVCVCVCVCVSLKSLLQQKIFFMKVFLFN